MWLARDKNGFTSNVRLFFGNKPVLWNNGTRDSLPTEWIFRDKNGLSLGSNSIELPKDLFPEVTFENSPIEVKILTLSQIENKYQEGYDNGYRAAGGFVLKHLGGHYVRK